MVNDDEDYGKSKDQKTFYGDDRLYGVRYDIFRDVRSLAGGSRGAFYRGILSVHERCGTDIMLAVFHRAA